MNENGYEQRGMKFPKHSNKDKMDEWKDKITRRLEEIKKNNDVPNEFDWLSKYCRGLHDCAEEILEEWLELEKEE